jgi:hypothetical protein
MLAGIEPLIEGLVKQEQDTV